MRVHGSGLARLRQVLARVVLGLTLGRVRVLVLVRVVLVLVLVLVLVRMLGRML